MNGLLEQAELAVGGGRLRFVNAASSVFGVTPFIDEADLGDDEREIALLGDVDEPDPESWQDAVGRRLLTPLEQDARERHFDRKTAVGIAAARKLRRGAAA